MEIRRVAVVGGGVMGRGIATTFVRGGFEVVLLLPAACRRRPRRRQDRPRLLRLAGKDVATLRRKNADKLRRILAIANE